MPRTTENAGEGRGSGHRGPAKGPAKGFAFGVASVTQALHGASFPISKEELMREHGGEEVHWTKDSSASLGDLLQEVDQDEFASVAEVASAVSEAHREETGDESDE